MPADAVVFAKSKRFAVRIVRLCQFLVKEKGETVMSKQVLRSGTSIGANIAEAECAISASDFINKMYVAFKECSETKYWLELLDDTGYLPEKAGRSIKQDCDELFRMLSSITKTTRQNQRAQKYRQ